MLNSLTFISTDWAVSVRWKYKPLHLINKILFIIALRISASLPFSYRHMQNMTHNTVLKLRNNIQLSRAWMGNCWENEVLRVLLLLCEQASECNFHSFSCSALCFVCFFHCFLFSRKKKLTDLCLTTTTTAVSSVSFLSRTFPSAMHAKGASELIAGLNFV